MTETPREPSGPGEWTPEYTTDYGSAPPPPPAGGQQPGYTPPAYTPPAPGTEAPAAQPTPDQPAGYQAPPAATSYQEQPPAVPGGYHAAATGFGYDRTALQNFDPKTINPLDWGIIAAGVVAFIFSLFKFYKYSVTIGPVSASETASAWHGFFGWFGVLVALLAALLLAAELIARMKFPFPTRLVVLGGFVIALICELLALLVVPGDTGGANGAFGIKIDKGHSFGYWITLIAVIVGTALAYKRFADSGGKLPRRSAA
jgi:hypothetical protein